MLPTSLTTPPTGPASIQGPLCWTTFPDQQGSAGGIEAYARRQCPIQRVDRNRLRATDPFIHSESVSLIDSPGVMAIMAALTLPNTYMGPVSLCSYGRKVDLHGELL